MSGSSPELALSLMARARCSSQLRSWAMTRSFTIILQAPRRLAPGFFLRMCVDHVMIADTVNSLVGVFALPRQRQLMTAPEVKLNV